jgi:hypothetical protein
MKFQPDNDYQTIISGVSQTEDNDGNPELHVHCGEGEHALAYKLKWKTKAEVTRSRDALVLLGVDVKKMAQSQSYVDGLGAMLSGKEIHIRTKPWEMLDSKGQKRTGVYIKQISPTPFEPIATAISKKMSRLLLADSDGPAPTPVDDDDCPF